MCVTYQPKRRWNNCDALRDLVSVTIWRLHGLSNECECMRTLFLPSCRFYLFAWISMAFERFYQMPNAWMPFKRVNTNNLMTLECCFLVLFLDFIVLWELQCNVILHFITSCTSEHFYLQCSLMFSLVCYGFYLLFTIFF